MSPSLNRTHARDRIGCPERREGQPNMYIQQLTIENVRRFGAGAQKLDLTLPERGWIVLAGPNGCGKTTVLQSIGLTLLRALPGDPLQGSFGWLRQGAVRGRSRLLLAPTRDDAWATDHEVTVAHADTDALAIEDYWDPQHGAMVKKSLHNTQTNVRQL